MFKARRIGPCLFQLLHAGASAMSEAKVLTPLGSGLTEDDYLGLARRWITRDLGDEAGLRRVDSQTGREMFARHTGDCAGIIIPYVPPGENRAVEYRLRVDTPEIEYRRDGTARETRKYIQPPGRANRLYFPPGLPTAAFADPTLPLIITEGEFKALALWRLANYQNTSLRFIPVALGGVNNWRGIVGKAVGANGKNHDVKGVIPDLERIVCKGQRIIIAFDADAEKNPQVRAARRGLATAAIERGAIVGFLEWPLEEGKGIDDRLVNVGAEKVLADIELIEFGGWQTRLLRNDKGKLISCYENVAQFLENSPDWVGALGYNEFTGGHFVLKQPPPPITAAVGNELEDHFDTEAVRWLERRGLMVKPDLVRRVVDAIARRNSYHPVRDYLNSLPAWDGKPRIGSWLVDYCGVESSDANPNDYAMAVGEKFLISAVARILEPGCKADHILVLEGDQGSGKSSATRILACEWFTDQLGEMGSKDAAMQVRGVWIVELSELGTLGRSETAREKAFISQQTERFRLPYGHRLVHVARQCVFIATTNSDTWLKDETGGRRFWPVQCRRIDLSALQRDRDQLWAEALARYRAGVPWWLEDAEVIQKATEEQRGRYLEDVWQDKVRHYAEEESTLPPSAPRGSASVAEILQRLGVETARQDQAAANRVARCLKVAGWKRKYVGPRGAREYRYCNGVPV
jgi:predicted P-loop ATPase